MESESHRLIHSLTAHLALYHSRLSNSSPSPAHRDSILRWFSSLSSAHRQAAVSVADSSFVQIVLQMHSRLRRQGHLHFLLLPDIPSSSHPFLPSLSFRLSRGLLSRSAASNSSAMLLSNSLLFFSSTSSGAASADALTVSESMVTDVDHFVGVMDGISGGRFLCEEVEMTGLTAQWAELPWLKDMGYYSLEAFLANRLEVALRLSWLSSQGGKKPKEKRLKERASEVAGKAANAFWRMKGCLGWWVGLDPDVHKVFISAFLGKAAKTLASQIIKEEDAALETRFDILDTGRNVKIKYSELSSWKKPKRSLLLRDADFGFDLDFFPSRVPNNLATIWNKLIVVQDISDMLLAWQSSNGEAEKLFFGSLSSVSTISDLITKKLQRFLMVVHYNLINYELMDDKIYTGRKAEEKSTSQYRKEKSKSYSSKKSNAILKTYNTTMSLESTKKLDGGTELCNKESASVLVAQRILDGVVSLAVNNVPEVEALATQEEMDNENARVSNDCMKNNGKRKNGRKGSKNKCSNLKNIGNPKCKDKDKFVSIAAERELTEIGYVCTTNSQPKSVDVSTCDNLLAQPISEISQERAMLDVQKSRQDSKEFQCFSLAGGRSTTNEECHPFSCKSGSDMSKCLSPCIRKSEKSLQTTYSTDPNKLIDPQMVPTNDYSPHACEPHDAVIERKQEHLITRVARGTASKSFVSKESLHTEADNRRSAIYNSGSECFSYGGIDSMAGISYEWPNITPLHFPSVNSHLPTTDRLHLDVGVRFSNHQSFMPSKTHVGNPFSESIHSQILPSLTYPISYDWPPMIKKCSILSQPQTISYESAYSQNLSSSFLPILASCAPNGVQNNMTSGDKEVNEVKHTGDVIDVFDMKNVSDFVEDESYWFSEDETEPQARSERDYNKYFGGGLMYWNPTELVGIGFSRAPSHSSEDSSWAWHEADLNRTIDDMVGVRSGLPTYNANGRGSPPSSYCSPFDNLTSAHQSLGYAVSVHDGSSTAAHSPSLLYPSDEKISSSTSNSAACIEGVIGDSFPYPMLRPIIIPGMSRKGSRSDLKLGRDNKSPCLPSARRENPRIKRPPSPVVLCVPRVPRPPSTVGESRKRGFPIVRSGSSSPRHWGVKSWCHEESIVAETHLCLDGAEVVWPAWARKGLGVTAVAQSLQGSLLQDHLITISQLARDQEHPDVALPLQPTDLLNGPLKGSLSLMHNVLHEEIDFFCKQVATKNLIRKPYINWAVKRVTRSLQVLWPRSRTSIFGSNATGLALPTSDVDVVVSLPPVRNLEPIKEAGILEGRNGIKETCLQHATRYLANQEWVRNDSLKTIENTAIPLIVLVAEVPSDIILSHGPSSFVDISKEKSSNISGEHYGVNSLLNVSGLENGITSKTSKSTKDDAVVGSKSVHLDISFKSTSHTGLQTSELVRELTQQFPASVPLALVLKKFLADRSLDHSYSGGLSSYCLVLLITRFLQHEHHCGHSMRQNLGSLLMDFFYFFGNVFDPRHMRISIQGSGVYMKRERGHSIDPIHIDDPLFPTNNVGRNCFRIHQCIKAFADAFTTLENELTLFFDESVPTSTQPFNLLRKIVPSIDCLE